MVNVLRCILLCYFSWPSRNPVLSLHLPVKNDSREHLELAELTLVITQKFINNVTSTLVVVERHSYRETEIQNIVLLEHILKNVQANIAVQLQISCQNKQPWEYYIFLVDSIDAFRLIYNLFPVSSHERHFYFLIILTNYTQDFNATIKQIFTLCYQLNVIDVAVIVKHPEDGVCIYTYLFFSEKSCRTIQPIVHHKHITNFENIKTIFPRKLNNFYGCPIYITGRKMGPFLDFIGEENNPQPIGAWENLSGLEGFLIRELSRIMNFQLEILPFPNGRSYVDNSTCFGAFLELQNGNADIAIGAFNGSDRLIFSPSTAYHSCSFVYVVRGTELNGMDRLAKPFSSEVWILLAFILLICFGFLLVQKNMKNSVRKHIFGDDISAPTLNFFGILLGYSINRIPSARRNFARISLLVSLLLTLVLRSAYQGSMYDAIRRDGFARTPKGYKDLEKWNYKILVSEEVANLSILRKNLVIPSGGYLSRIKTLETIDGPFASVILRESYVHYMEANNWKRNGLIMTNDVFLSYHLSMIFPKNSMLLETFNNKLKVLANTGLLNKLKVNLTTEAALRSIGRKEPSKLALGNKRLSGMYDIYIVMIVIAVVVFGLEVVSVRCKKLQRFVEWIE